MICIDLTLVPNQVVPPNGATPKKSRKASIAARTRSSSIVAFDGKTPSDENTKETKNKRENRERMNAMATGVLELLDEGIRPLLDVCGHGAHQ
jgi:hypothetical protein